MDFRLTALAILPIVNFGSYHLTKLRYAPANSTLSLHAKVTTTTKMSMKIDRRNLISVETYSHRTHDLRNTCFLVSTSSIDNLFLILSIINSRTYLCEK